MKTMSMLQFRRNAKRALLAVQRGERLLLTYRGRPVARLEPVRPAATALASDDSLLRIDDYAVDGPAGKLSNATIDRTLYGAKGLR